MCRFEFNWRTKVRTGVIRKPCKVLSFYRSIVIILTKFLLLLMSHSAYFWWHDDFASESAMSLATVGHRGTRALSLSHNGLLPRCHGIHSSLWCHQWAIISEYSKLGAGVSFIWTVYNIFHSAFVSVSLPLFQYICLFFLPFCLSYQLSFLCVSVHFSLSFCFSDFFPSLPNSRLSTNPPFPLPLTATSNPRVLR